MFKRLKHKFVLITLALTSVVLVSVLGWTLFTAWSTQRSIISASLAHAIHADFDRMPMMGDEGMRDIRGGQGGSNLLAVTVDVAEGGVIIRSSRTPLVIDSTLLAEVVNTALNAGEDTGSIPDLHIAWRRLLKSDYDELSYSEDYYDEFDDLMDDDAIARVAIVDTTALDNSLSEQIKGTIVAIVAALLGLFGISWVLSSWALAPVARAWEDQKRFVADASHELKTPLAVIIANTDILRADETLPKESQRWVESTADEAAHMRSLVNDLLELARADEGASSGAMRKEDVDLSDVVDSAALEFDAIAFERGCMIETAIEPGIHVQGDPEWLERLAKILVDNASKYAQAGTSIDVVLSRSQGHVTLSVTNRGNVIDPEDLAHIFDRFYRSDKARTRGTGGFGLGLAIAKGIAEAHGGKIAATSTAEQGTTFTVTL